MYTLEIQNGSDSSGCFCLRVATSTRLTTLCNAQRRLLHDRESSFTTHVIFYTFTAEKVTLHFTINMKQIALGESAKIKSHELRQPFWKSHLQIEAETYYSAGTRSLGLLEMQIRTKGRSSGVWNRRIYVMADIVLPFPQRQYNLIRAIIFYCTRHDTAAEVPSKVKHICNLGCSISRTVCKQWTRSGPSESDWTTHPMHCLPYSFEIKYLFNWRTIEICFPLILFGT